MNLTTPCIGRLQISPSPRRPLTPSFRLSALALLLAASLPLLPAAAQEDAEERSPYLPGLVARYTSDEVMATRVDESIAFDWGEAAPDPRLPPGNFQTVWTGRLWTQVAGHHRLAAFVGGGKCRVKLGESEILVGDAEEPRWISSEPIELQFDRHPLTVQFNKSAASAQLKLYWSGPGFGLEPIPTRFLMHDRDSTVSPAFERGQRLAAALRCGACHRKVADREELHAPALEKLAGNLHPAWLVDWLSPEAGASEATIARRMPHFGLTPPEAANLTSWLLRPVEGRAPDSAPPAKEQKDATKPKGGSDKAKGSSSKPSAQEGQRLFVTRGCLACHQRGELGESGLFGGGDLTKIAAKRPPEFFARWLADPANFNRHHRMPVFDLSSGERSSLSLFLAEGIAAEEATGPRDDLGDPAAGKRLALRLRCGSCHALPGDAVSNSPRLPTLSAESRWAQSCAGQADPKSLRPGYRLAAVDQEALKTYYSAADRASPGALQARGRDLLVELNCLACHAREGIDRVTNSLPATLQEKLAAVVAIHDELGKQVPAMTPPALNSVGDKLHDAALADAILRKGPPHRPYLLVQMPKFTLTSDQLAALTAYFTATDRIPSGASFQPASDRRTELHSVSDGLKIRPTQLAAAGPRLVTTDGFGCTSCHQVGSVLPDKAPLNARGPSLSLLDKRIRRAWFDRWCANPARIVPRMEMPSVQIPVRGVLNDNVRDQLAAVWHILNTPGFEPPEPDPVRVLRLSGVPERKEQPIVLHDVIKAGDKTYLFPLVIGLPNRHNILFDLETNRLAAWWLGDTARQRTKGKSWYWEAGGESIFAPGYSDSELSLDIDGKEHLPHRSSQFAGTVDYINRSRTEALIFGRNLEFEVSTREAGAQRVTVRVIEVIRRLDSQAGVFTGFARQVGITGVPPGARARLRIVSEELFHKCTFDEKSKTLVLPGANGIRIRLDAPEAYEWTNDGSFSLKSSAKLDSFPSEKISLEYRTSIPVDRYAVEFAPPGPLISAPVQIAPGFAAQRLPLVDDIMPSALAWKPDGRLVFSTLKGQVFVASDSDEDTLQDKLRLLEDGLATPYGLLADEDHVDVLVKSGLLHLVGIDQSSVADRQFLIASGWGVTDDYHDWAVGLVPGNNGEYYIGLPCQQDQRSEAAAKHRGQLLKLVPRKATAENPRLFDIEVVSSGHRFPMGFARNREGELFVTDNQGNYNPFNELNHVRPGAHFGFINAVEKERGFKPPRLDKPAIDIPHPWTRSVNGICFLDTPKALREKTGKDAFGPLEGHLVGCEYDTRQLIRMTLQKVGDTYQGAAYPLSIAPENVEDGLLGPIVCAVSPRGELYVGNIRDSGWGAGNNVGDVVQIKIEPEKLPCGIAEVRATKDGFTLDFFRPVDRAKAADPANYLLASYRRESTPAYGGPNLDRRIEKIDSIEISPDAKRVTLRLASLRAGFLYEFQLKPLVRGKELFHPAEAHYTLNQIPDRTP